MAEVSQHTGEVEACDPFPGVLLLARAVRFCRSKREDAASEFGQSRRSDHDLIHALVVLHVKYANADRLILPNQQMQCCRATRRGKNTRFYRGLSLFRVVMSRRDAM